MKLSIIIVNYNVKYYIEQCILSILKSQKIENDYEIIVIDNDSTDQSVKYLRNNFPKNKFPHIQIIENHKNLGFGKANNLAFEHAKGEYILFLNPDTVITENTLSESIKFAESRSRLGALGIKMLKDNGDYAKESKRGIPTPWTAFCKMSGLTKLFPKSKKLGKYYLGYLDKDKANSIEIVSGAYMMIKRSVIEKVGLFDEKFFMYGEDIDLSYRLLLHGYRNYYLPFPILHYKGESTHKNSYRYVRIFYKAMIIFFKKYYRHLNLFYYLPVMAVIILKGCMSFFKQQLFSIKQRINKINPNPKYKCLYLGENINKIKHLAQYAAFQVDVIYANEISHPMGHKMLEGGKDKEYLYIAYDTASFSYEKIIQIFESSDHEYFMGFFYPEKLRLITGGDIYAIKGDKNH